MDLAFVLLEEARYPAGDDVVAAAAEAGLTVTPSAEPDGGPMQLDVEGGGTLMVMIMDAPHPDVSTMAVGPLSPERDAMLAARAHAIVTVMGIEGDVGERDRITAALAAAVAKSVPAVAAMLGHGLMFYPADLFVDLAFEAAREETVPVEILVDVTAAREDDTRMSFLTHGLSRYQREEFYMTAPIDGSGALPFLLDLVRWMVFDPDKHLPTGETLGRDANERIEIQRVPSPLGEGPEVIKLDLPA